MTRWRATLLLTILAAGAEAHPLHRSTARVEVNREASTLEVALRVHPADLRRALAAQEPEAAPGPAQRTTRYLRRRFLVTSEGGPTSIRWVGQERDGADIWLYFEVLLPEGRASLHNQVFFELASDHINVVQLRDGRSKRAVAQTKRSEPLRIRVGAP